MRSRSRVSTPLGRMPKSRQLRRPCGLLPPSEMKRGASTRVFTVCSDWGRRVRGSGSASSCRTPTAPGSPARAKPTVFTVFVAAYSVLSIRQSRQLGQQSEACYDDTGYAIQRP
ncbi:ORF1 [Opuntia umbra-like virus]|nr:ORF1 [Opuntia umbra-like virus]